MNNQSVMIPLKKYQVLPKSIVLNKYKHKTFEERVAEYNGEISVCDFDWGEPVGKEKEASHDRNPIESLVII